MRLASALASTSFGLDVVGYEFPAVHRGMSDEDADWLLVRTTVCCLGESWETRAPMMTASELVELAGWFDAVAADGDADRLGFIEPNLIFECHREGGPTVVVVVEFDQESVSPRGTRLIEIVPTAEALSRTARELRVTCRDWPSRSGSGSTWPDIR